MLTALIFYNSKLYKFVSMSSNTAKENILRKIREALTVPTEDPVAKPDFSAPIYSQTTSELSIQFAEVFVKNKGEFFFCENQQEFISHLQLLLEKRNLHEVYVWESQLQEILKKPAFHLGEMIQNSKVLKPGLRFVNA